MGLGTSICILTNELLDFYRMGNDHLGSGAYASVRTATSISTGKEYAVKLVGKHEPGHTRSRILREVDTFKMCKNHPNIVQLIEVGILNNELLQWISAVIC